MTRARLIVVTGKGGSGRSTVAAGLACHRAAQGQRVLAVDVTASGGLAMALAWGSPPAPGVVAKSEGSSLSLLALSTETALDEYLKLNIKLALGVRNLGPVARILDYVATAAPAVREILSIGKIGHEVRSGPWDLVVVDAPATGHVIELLSAPDALRPLVGRGPLLGETVWLSELLADPEITVAVAVCLAEELVVNETVDLVARLRSETSVHLAAAVANRLPPPVGDEGEREAEGLRRAGHPLAAVAELAVDRSRRSSAQRERLLALGCPVLDVADEPGRGSAAVASALTSAGW